MRYFGYETLVNRLKRIPFYPILSHDYRLGNLYNGVIFSIIIVVIIAIIIVNVYIIIDLLGR